MRRLAGAGGSGLMAGPALLGILMVGASLLPYVVAKGYLDSLSPDGTVEWFTPTEFHSRARTLRALGAVLVVGGGVLFAMRAVVLRALFRLAGDTAALAGEGAVALREGLRREERPHLVALTAIVCAGLLVRVAFLAQPLRFDEAFTLLGYASYPLPVIISDYSWPNNHIFHTLLVSASTRLFGDGLWAIRLPAFSAGVLMIPATYLVGRSFYDRTTALLAAALVAASSPLVLYSTNARGYTIVALLFLLLLPLARYQRDHSRPGGWVIFALLAAVGCYTVPTMLYPLGIVAAWLALSALAGEGPVGRRRLLRDLAVASAGAGAVTFVLYLPVLFHTGLGSITANESVRPLSWGGFAPELPVMLAALWDSWNEALPAPLELAAAAGFAVAVLLHRRIARDRVSLVLATLAWCVPLLLLTRRPPFLRVWLFLLPLYFVVAGAGLSCLLSALERRSAGARRFLAGALALALAVWAGGTVFATQSVHHSEETGTFRDAAAQAAFLGGYLRPGDRVLARIPANAPLEYYAARAGISAEPLSRPVGDARRVLLVVNDGWGQTLDSLWRAEALAEKGFEVPRLVRRFPSSSLYEATPRREGPRQRGGATR